MFLTKIVVVIAILFSLGLMQKTVTKPILLSSDEAKEIQAAVKEITAVNAELQQGMNQILSVPLDKTVDVISAVGKAQLLNQKLQTMSERAERVRDKHRAKYACIECSYSSDFTALTAKDKE